MNLLLTNLLSLSILGVFTFGYIGYIIAVRIIGVD